MTEGQTVRSRARRRRRLPRLSVLAVLLIVVVSALPGSASAAPPPKVVPLLDCYAQNDDGTVTVILAYRNGYSTTQTIPQGSNNYMTPSTYTSQLPTVFAPGEQRGAAKLTIAAADWNSGMMSWTLDGTTLSSRNVTLTLCTAAQLPALANGGALALLLLIALGVGVALVRRARRRLTAAAPAL